jgi:tetratricopeptide (TPR) repeat protein
MAAPRDANSDELFKRGRQLVLEALAMDDQLPEVHAVLGKHYLYHQDDFFAAERHARRAAELSPDDGEALRLLCIIEKILGRLDEAIATAQRATRVAPELPHLWNALGDVLLAAGRNAEAVEALKRAIALQTAYVPALERMELARLHLGEADYAIEVRAVRLRVTGRGARAAQLEDAALSAGAVDARHGDIRRELDELLENAARENPFAEYYVSRTIADRIIEAYAELGEWPKAMDWVQRSFEDRPGRLRRVLTDQPFDRRGLAADPRYARLLRAAGLAELM